MQSENVYRELSVRTGGRVYLGVVGGVRTGKSTFIKRFMDTLVIPHISDDALRRRTIDELPQSAGGRTIMTTEPKFIPEDAVTVELDNNITFDVRMIDCVGYIVPSALGYIEDEQPRMVKTPWFDEEIPFNMAAEIGTQKVITEHSTVGIVITTDGSVTDIPREEYEEAEQRVIKELQDISKPFVVLLNCADPASAESAELAKSMSERYGVGVIPVNCLEMGEEEIVRILTNVLFEFSVNEIAVDMPGWIVSLEREHRVRREIFDAVRESAGKVSKLRDLSGVCGSIGKCEYVKAANITGIDLGAGKATMAIDAQPELFCEVAAEKTGMEIKSESDILRTIVELSEVKEKFDKLRAAYTAAQDTGYGIVMPSMDELSLEAPQIIRQGNRYGIKLRATAPSIHMLKTNITTEVTPIVGSEEQSEELVSYLLSEFEDDPGKIWESNIFGKSLNELVNEGITNKLQRMPAEARGRINETIERIINDGCNGLICIIL